MTERLYYQDATLREFTAHLVERRQDARGVWVRLDRTAFYPTSGGQPHDCGTLGGAAVLDVVDEEGVIWHLLAGEPASGVLSGVIEWPRRFDHMQQHTGQHMLSAAFVKELDAMTLSFHMGESLSTIDVRLPQLTWEEAQRVEARVNAAIWGNLPVEVRIVPPEVVPTLQLRKPPQVSGPVRVVSVIGFDHSACGGTHVSRTGEIGLVKIVGLERYKGGVRVTFVCGQRALADYQRVLRLAQEIGARLSVGLEEAPSAVERLQEDSRTLRHTLGKAQGELLAGEAERLWQATSPIEGVRRIVAVWERPFAEVQALARALREHSSVLALLAAREPDGAVRLVCARSDDLPEVDAGARLRAAASALGGRGGGSSVLAQGGAGAHPAEAVLAALRRALE